MTPNNHTIENLKQQARALGLHGLLARWNDVANAPWLPDVLRAEDHERARRSLERRTRNAKLGAFKPLADFEWDFPTDIDRELVEELLALSFIAERTNVIIVGQNGAGKTMLAKNIAHHAIVNGYSALFVTASELLNDLAAQPAGSALTRRLRHYCRPQVLVIDELGYLASSSEHADLLFQLVTERYQEKPIILTANKKFEEWGDVFPNAACVVALVDRLVHSAEILTINVPESYRLKEARERLQQRKKAKPRTSRKRKEDKAHGTNL